MSSVNSENIKYPYQMRSLEDLDGEIWKPIAGYDNLFYISNFGRVKSFARSIEGKIIPQRLYKKGERFLTFKISINGEECEFRTAVIVYRTFIRDLDFKIFNIKYSDGNRLNLCPTNLIAYKRYKQVQQEKKYHKQQLIEATASMYQYPYQNLSLVDMDGEIWKPFPELPDYYAISNKGRVKSLKRECAARDKGIRINEARILKQRVQSFTNPNTKEIYHHLSVCTNVGYIKHEYTISRLVYEAFIAPIDKNNSKLIIRHKDDNSFNNTLENLYLSNKTELQNELIKTGKRHRLTGCSDVAKFTHEDWESRYDTTRRPVSQFDLEGKYIRTFESRKQAAESIGIKQSSSIWAAAIGKIHTVGGYQWRSGSDRSPMKPAKEIKPHLKKPFQAKKVGKYDLEGNLLKEYSSVIIAAKENNIQLERLYSYIKNPNRIPRSGKRFLWKYI